jgi:hypothetical protein
MRAHREAHAKFLATSKRVPPFALIRGQHPGTL